MSDGGRDERDEARVRAAVDALREHDAVEAPSFARTWAAAAASQRPARSFAPWLAAGAGAAAMAVAVLLGLAIWSVRPPRDDVAADRALAARVATMRAEPLAFAAALPTPGAFGGGGWFAQHGARPAREEDRSW